MARRSLALSDMLGWFSRVDRVDCEALLVGCELEADEDAESGAVTAVEWGSEPVPLAIGLAGGRRVLFRKVAREGSFTDARPGRPLLTAFEAARTATERAADEDRGVLAAARIREEWLRSAADRQALAGFLRELEQRRLPSAAARHASYLAFRSGEVELARVGAQLVRRLVGLYERECEPIPEDCHWRLAVLLRQACAAREALVVSDVLEGRKLRDLATPGSCSARHVAVRRSMSGTQGVIARCSRLRSERSRRPGRSGGTMTRSRRSGGQ